MLCDGLFLLTVVLHGSDGRGYRSVLPVPLKVPAGRSAQHGEGLHRAHRSSPGRHTYRSIKMTERGGKRLFPTRGKSHLCDSAPPEMTLSASVAKESVDPR